MSEVSETARDRMRRYRVEAEECRANAAKTTDAAVRPASCNLRNSARYWLTALKQGLGLADRGSNGRLRVVGAVSMRRETRLAGFPGTVLVR